MGDAYRLKGDAQKAMEYFNCALSVQLKMLHSDHPAIALTYVNIGNLYFSGKNYSESLKNYVSALDILSKHKAPDMDLIEKIRGKISIAKKNGGVI